MRRRGLRAGERSRLSVGEGCGGGGGGGQGWARCGPCVGMTLALPEAVAVAERIRGDILRWAGLQDSLVSSDQPKEEEKSGTNSRLLSWVTGCIRVTFTEMEEP